MKQTEKILIACGIFSHNLDFMKELGLLDVDVVYLDSMLHMNPMDLKKQLDRVIEENSEKQVLLVYGDCHANMLDYELNPKIQRIQGVNCCDILIGKDKYAKLRAEGAFILLSEWAHRWREAFIEDMGFENPDLAKEFMREMHTKIVFVDFGIQSIEPSVLREIEDYLGLPVTVIYEKPSIFVEKIIEFIK